MAAVVGFDRDGCDALVATTSAPVLVSALTRGNGAKRWTYPNRMTPASIVEGEQAMSCAKPNRAGRLTDKVMTVQIHPGTYAYLFSTVGSVDVQKSPKDPMTQRRRSQ